MQNIGLYLMSLLYTAAGIYHFVKPRFYLAIMPPYIPNHSLMVALSGVAEIVLGIALLFPATRSWAAWGIILMLVVFLPVHIYMITSGKFLKIPELLLYVRILLQFVLIYWAYRYV
jgi:uncharacterized membrane protein